MERTTLDNEISTGVRESMETPLKSPERSKRVTVPATVCSRTVPSLKNTSVLYVCVVLLAGAVLVSGKDLKWQYYADGMETGWSETCKGQNQSPININHNDLQLGNVAEINLGNYDKLISTESENNGYKVVLRVKPEDDIYVEEDKEKYVLQEVHFHWESEHSINGKRLPLEVQLQHKRTDDDWLVLTTFYDLDTDNNTKIKSMVESLDKVSNLGVKSTVEIVPKSLLPEDLNKYYRYSGSQTEPNCLEIYKWVIFESTGAISLDQYDVFRGMEMHNGTYSWNYRHTQPLNKRQVAMHTQLPDKTLQKPQVKDTDEKKFSSTSRAFPVYPYLITIYIAIFVTIL